MASPSKEENVLKLILENSPLKEWHFEEVVKEAKVTKAVANKWLRKYVKQGLLKKVKEKGKFPFFIVESKNYTYYSLKRVYALEQLHKSGLIAKLLSLHKAKTIIFFGSIIKGDWYKDSDIDIFILGDITDFNKNIYENKLNKQIELHIFENKKDIKEIKSGLIKNIINGYLIKGQIQDIVEVS
ncbi:MAG: nucleotidyltransferase domain-containing protein [Candidatus Woesearchaeota archaeon]